MHRRKDCHVCLEDGSPTSENLKPDYLACSGKPFNAEVRRAAFDKVLGMIEKALS
jgi:hypothetical protein